MKTIGLILAWGVEKWIDLTIRQALSICDEVIVSVDWHMESMRKHEDSTLQICLGYGDRIRMVPTIRRGNHVDTKSATMNSMLASSKNFSTGNLIWLLDVDEFYHEEDAEIVKKIMVDRPDVSNIVFHTKAFFINMDRYLVAHETRLWRIRSTSDHFIRTNAWSGKFDRPVEFSDGSMYHYTMLRDPYAKMDFWRSEYNHSQEHKVRWMKDIYMKYDLADEDAWNQKNKELFGKASPFGISDWETDGGRLFHHLGKHPRLIMESGMTSIDDFRKMYMRN